MSQTGSVSVFGGEPNPVEAMLGREPPEMVEDGRGGGTGTDGTFWLEEVGGGGGMFDWMNGAEETGMVAGRGGLGGRAGRTVAGLALIRFSIDLIVLLNFRVQYSFHQLQNLTYS